MESGTLLPVVACVSSALSASLSCLYGWIALHFILGRAHAAWKHTPPRGLDRLHPVGASLLPHAPVSVLSASAVPLLAPVRTHLAASVGPPDSPSCIF